jgi:hypothetical protein
MRNNIPAQHRREPAPKTLANAELTNSRRQIGIKITKLNLQKKSKIKGGLSRNLGIG